MSRLSSLDVIFWRLLSTDWFAHVDVALVSLCRRWRFRLPVLDTQAKLRFGRVFSRCSLLEHLGDRFNNWIGAL